MKTKLLLLAALACSNLAWFGLWIRASNRPHNYEIKQVTDRLGNAWFLRANTENGQICVVNLSDSLWIEMQGPGLSNVFGCGK